MADKEFEPKKHGRETYVEYYGNFVIKRPLPKLGDEARQLWLMKQHKTKSVTDAVRAIGNPTYNIPEMYFVHDGDMQVLEERAPGEPLTAQLYRKLSKRQQYEVVNSLGQFLVDINESQPIGEIERYRIAGEIKLDRLNNFIENKMSRWFTDAEVTFMSEIRDAVSQFEYETCRAWSHCDLNSGNVLYDADASKLWIIDFAEADYKFIYRDIFSPVAVELDICRRVYDAYNKFHNRERYQMPGVNNGMVREIMKYRTIVVLLRRFGKAADDLRMNPVSPKGEQNNLEKVVFMRGIMNDIRACQARNSR